MRGPLLERVEDVLDPVRVLGAAEDGARGMDERADRRERVVHLVAHEPDHLLPDLHLAPAQLGREALDEDQHVAPSIEMEDAPDRAVGLVVVLLDARGGTFGGSLARRRLGDRGHLRNRLGRLALRGHRVPPGGARPRRTTDSVAPPRHGEEAAPFARQRLGQLGRAAGEHVHEGLPLEPMAATEERARGAVRQGRCGRCPGRERSPRERPGAPCRGAARGT